MTEAKRISLEQQRLWVLHQLEHARTAFNLPVFVRFSGKLDRFLLEKSLRAALSRHPILTSRFIRDNGQLVQIPAPPGSDILSFVDLTAFSTTDREDRVTRLSMQEQNTPFQLETDSPLRATLLRLDRHDHVLLITVHQIACDRASAYSLLSEIARVYNAGGDDSNGHPAPQYAEYVAWQQQYLDSTSANADLVFWKQQLEGAAAGIELPTDYPRPPEPSFRGRRRPLVLPQSLVARLLEREKQPRSSRRVALLSALVGLLCRYTGLDEIVVGTELSGRTLTDAKVIGPFVRDLVLRVDTSENPSFRELQARIRDLLSQAEAHQHVPFAKLLDCLHVERDLSRNPLFQVKLAEDPGPRIPSFNGLKTTELPLETVAETLDLNVHMTERPDGLDLTLSYSTDLFSEATIERMCTHLQLLLTALAEDDPRPIFELPMLPDSERQQLIADWNRTQIPYQRQCIHQLFESQARHNPSAEAVRMGDRGLSYAELNTRANQLGRYLRKRGIGTGSLIGIYVERSLDMLIALLGVLKSGAAYVPLDPAYPPDRISFILQDAGIPLVLTQEALLDTLPGSDADVICMDTAWAKINEEDARNPSEEFSWRNLAYVLYTSGSTGKPKGVEIEHGSVVNFLSSMRKQPGFDCSDVLLAVTTLSFDIAGLELYLPLVSGGRLVIAGREETIDGAALQRLLQTGITVMQATPATWRLLLESGWSGDLHLKILCGGEALPRDLAKELLPRCGALWNMYGPTETTIWSSLYQVTEVNWSMAPIGKPIDNTQMYVLDKTRQVLPVGVAGELYIGGDGLARGYHKRPQLTAEKFVPHPFSPDANARLYMTGDLARYLPDGNVQYLGRIDSQVKVRGFRIELGEIETVVAQHPAVQQAVAVVREVSGDKQIVAYIKGHANANLELGELRVFAKQKLPEYMVPWRFVILDEFPLTPNGKVDRKALPPPARELPSSGSETYCDELETKLVAIFESVLGVHPVGVTDDFFELGGHSIMAARLITEIYKLTGKQLPLNTLFHAANVRYLRKVLAQPVAAPEQSIVTQVQAGDPSSPIFFAVISPGESGVGYAILARQMGLQYRFFQLQADTPIAIERPYTWGELETLAEQYVAAMRKVQPRGPYCLGGMCDGAHIAIRMARHLEQDGQSVGLLAIFDTWVLENSQHPLLWRFYYYSQRLRQLRMWSLKEKIDAVYRALERIVRRMRGRQERSTWAQTYWPQQDYTPPHIHSRVTLFRRPKQPYYYRRDPLMGWGERSAGVDVHVLPIYHQEMLREPSVELLARSLVSCLQKVQLPASTATSQPQAVPMLDVPVVANSLHEAV